MIFVHGGLNEFQDALLLSAKRLETMREEPGEAIYPIFVLWRSGLIPFASTLQRLAADYPLRRRLASAAEPAARAAG